MSDPVTQPNRPITFLPSIEVGDDLAAYWLAQVTFRLRREIAWLWQLRGQQLPENPHALPPFQDRLIEILDLGRYSEERLRFFREDEACQYLDSQLSLPAPDLSSTPLQRGSFSWLVQELSLDPVACFTLALALHPSVDSGTSTVISSCLNDPSRNLPSLALAQRLWDEPSEFFSIRDLNHPLFSHGLLAPDLSGQESLTWETALTCEPSITRCLLYQENGRPFGTPGLNLLPKISADAIPQCSSLDCDRILPLLKARPDQRRIIPIRARNPEDGFSAARELASQADRLIARIDSSLLESAKSTFTLAWLQGLDIAYQAPPLDPHHSIPLLAAEGFPPANLPINIFLILPIEAKLPSGFSKIAPIELLRPGFEQRLRQWKILLEGKLSAKTLSSLPDIARRFRLDQATITNVAAQLLQIERPLTPEDLHLACQSAVTLDLGGRATKVTPRFKKADLALPPTQQRQVDDMIGAISALTKVHYEWGTAQPWNESGLSALFAGPPGTGKSMTSEIIAAECGLPLYRVDLSQVVNKYIGETEKNLRLIFDAADNADICIVFDEADALFGKRSEVRDAHDRFANIEVSYLLQRMEEFRGVAILTSNRKKDLDEAFLRRLRFVIDFPMPGADERIRLWTSMIPEGVDGTELDLPFLASFPLAGGHIRSIVFAACLQAAHQGETQKLTMPIVLHALKREYDKLERALPTGQIGAYRDVFASFLD